MSHGTFFQLRRQGVIPTIKVGAAAYFDRYDLDVAIERLRAQQGEDGGQ